MKVPIIEGMVDEDNSMVSVLFRDVDLDFPSSEEQAVLSGTAYWRGEGVFMTELASIWTTDDGDDLDLGAECTATVGEEVVWCDLEVRTYHLREVEFVNTYGPIEPLE